MVTERQAELCGDFMIDMDPGEVEAPMYVLDALDDYQYIVEHGNDARAWKNKEEYAKRLGDAIEQWLRRDRAACIALLGPGLGLDQ